MADISLEVGLVAIIVLLVLAPILYSGMKGRRRQTPGVVVIREGRLPGEPRVELRLLKLRPQV